MDDKLKHLLQTQIEREVERAPRDLGHAMDRGRRKRTVTRLGVGFGVILLAAAIAWTAVAMPFADDASPDIVGPGPTASSNTYNIAIFATADFTAPLFVETELISTDELVVQGVTVNPTKGRFPTAVIVSFPGPENAGVLDKCVASAKLRLHILGQPDGDPSIAAYPSRVFDAGQVERKGRLADNDGTLISNVPRGEPTTEGPEGWTTWDVTDIYKRWFSERHFIGNYESVAVPDGEIVFSLRDESGEGPGFTASFASLEYAEAHSTDDLSMAPTLQLSVHENCQSGSEEEPSPTAARGLIEDMPEQTRAEIFAFRALANTDLMDPFAARTYLWTYRKDTTETQGGWRIGFAASDCEPKNNSQTCTGLSGEDPTDGNALTDTYLYVALNDGAWEVLTIEGNMPAEDQERIIGYNLPDEREASHWDFAAVAVGQIGADAFISMIPIWVGPYPTAAPGSRCEITGLDGDGKPVGRTITRDFEPPKREFERGGWVAGLDSAFGPQVVDAEAECEQHERG